MTKKKTKKKTTKKKVNKRRKGKKTIVKGSKTNGTPAKQILFCHEYLKDLNATAAAIRAGYAEKAASQTAYKLLQTEKIQRKIEDLLDQRAFRCGVHADRVVKELARIAFSDITDYLRFNESGLVLKNSDQLTDDQRKAIGEIRENVTQMGSNLSFKLHNKIEALKALAAHLGMNKQQVEHNVKSEGEAKVVFFPSNGRELPRDED